MRMQELLKKYLFLEKKRRNIKRSMASIMKWNIIKYVIYLMIQMSQSLCQVTELN